MAYKDVWFLEFDSKYFFLAERDKSINLNLYSKSYHRLQKGGGLKSVKFRSQEHDHIPSYLMLWNTGAVKHRSCETKEQWNTWKVKHWSFETQELWYTGAVKLWSSEKLGKILAYVLIDNFPCKIL